MMKVTVIGAGAIGGLVAGYLSKEGVDVTLIGKEKDVLAIKESGLFIEGVRGKLNIAVDVREGFEDNPDFFILAVKTQDIPGVLNKLPQNIPVLTVQNGVRAEKILSNYIPREMIIASVVMFGATYLYPGRVLHNFEGDWVLGKPFSKNDEETEEIANLLSKAFSVHLSPEIQGIKWLKLFLNLNNGLPALINKSMQETFSDLEICQLGICLLKEALTVITQAGIELKSLPGFPVERLYALTSMPLVEAARIFSNIMQNLSEEPLYGSVLQSIKRNRASEIDYLNGEIVSLAQEIGTKAVLNEKLVELVHAVEKNHDFLEKEAVLNAFRR